MPQNTTATWWPWRISILTGDVKPRQYIRAFCIRPLRKVQLRDHVGPETFAQARRTSITREAFNMMDGVGNASHHADYRRC